MRVGIDARALASETPTGVERYVISLVRGLAELDDAPEIIAYLDRPIGDRHLERVANSGPLKTRLIRARRGWLRAALPWHLWRDRVEVVHLPSTILPPLLPCPAVVTVHDLAWTRYPETYPPDDLRMQRTAVPRAVRRAAHVITCSQSTARDVAEVLGVPARKMTAIPLAAAPEFSPDGPGLPADAFPGADRLARGYILHCGRLEPRKNLLRLLDAYRKAREDTAVPPLVLVGGHTEHADELAARAREIGVADEVLLPGYLPASILPALYRSASICVYPSLYEGFGYPVAEAMASGTPVITSNLSSMPEVAGDAALLVDPASVDELASALVRMLSDDALRRDLGARGLARSRGFNWLRVAGDTAAVYRRVADGKAPRS